MEYPVPNNEPQRLENLASFAIMNSVSEQEYDDITFLTAHICNTPISTIAFIDKDKKWHKSKYGTQTQYVPRENAICSHTIMNKKPLIINDTLKDDIFCDIGMVSKAPHVRFYASVPLVSPEGFAIGILCAVDFKPNSLSEFQQKALVKLVNSVTSLLVARRNALELKKNQFLLEQKQHEITELNRKLKHLSRTDELTGLWNRRVLNEILERELKLNSRGVHSLSVIMIDVDNFKTINDTLGHQVGDETICKIAQLLKKSIRATDYCIRYGGDEFILILPNMGREASEVLAQHILEETSELTIKTLKITISIGISIIDGDKQESDNVLQLADQCLYLAKQKGKNRIEIHS